MVKRRRHTHRRFAVSSIYLCLYVATVHRNHCRGGVTGVFKYHERPFPIQINKQLTCNSYKSHFNTLRLSNASTPNNIPHPLACILLAYRHRYRSQWTRSKHVIRAFRLICVERSAQNARIACTAPVISRTTPSN